MSKENQRKNYKIKDLPKIERPREKFLKKGPEALSKSDLLAILLGSGIKGKNVQKLAQQIIKKFGRDFLNITVDDLLKISGIGQAKALQIASAISLVKRFYEEEKWNEIVIKNSKDVLSLTYDLRDKKKEYLVCLYLNARNFLLKKEIISVGLLDKTLLHPREIFYPATELNAASVILIHNHPSGDSSPSEKDNQIVQKIVQGGEIMGIPVIDFIIISENNHYSFYEKLKKQKEGFDYVADGIQHSLFDLLETEAPAYIPATTKVHKLYFSPQKRNIAEKFQIQNRRFLGNKYKLLGFIEDIVNEKCNGFNSFCDIFAGTGVVGERFNEKNMKVIANDFLSSNFIPLKVFLGTSEISFEEIEKKINLLNGLESNNDNYFSEHFGNTYFTLENARKIGAIRENINEIAKNENEKAVLITALLYAVDKVANTVGHYDAYRKKLDTVQPLRLLIPNFEPENNSNNEIYNEDANQLIRKISCDVLYIDPPYNRRKYVDMYHVLENLTKWQKPKLYGKTKKFDRLKYQSNYNTPKAIESFIDLIKNANTKYILISYNNMGNKGVKTSQSLIPENILIDILRKKGNLEIFKTSYKPFNAGRSEINNHEEIIYFCKVK